MPKAHSPAPVAQYARRAYWVALGEASPSQPTKKPRFAGFLYGRGEVYLDLHKQEVEWGS